MCKPLWLSILFILSLGSFSLKSEQKPSEIVDQESVTIPVVREVLLQGRGEHKDTLRLYESFASLVEQMMSPTEEQQIMKALLFAIQVHEGQYRHYSNQEPYICYPLTVAILLLEKGKIQDSELVIAALLHDTARDHEREVLQEIRSLFGNRVVTLVEELSTYPISAKKSRQQALLAHAKEQSQEVVQVQLAALLYSIQELTSAPPSHWKEEQKDQYIEWAEALTERFSVPSLAIKAATQEAIAAYWDQQEKGD